MSDKKTCIRCGQVPPSDDPWHRGVGAISRTDNEAMICSNCGVEEAFEDWNRGSGGSGLTPQSEWPGRMLSKEG